ncbi:MAG: heme ABC transporter permease CcmC [Magnetococcus sp. DMHC-6]
MKRVAKIQKILGVITLILLGAGLWLAWTAPIDFQQGNSVRILYLHVPSAKIALLSYLVLAIASGIFLWRRNEMADIVAEAVVPIGAIFSFVTLASGSIWGKPMWGTYWTWDARLTSMLILLILYMGLLAMRHALDDPGKGARATAVLALVGFVDLPIIHFSVKWWRTLHQPPSFSGPADKGITIAGPLLMPLIVMAVAFIALGSYLLIVKIREVAAKRELEAIEAEKLYGKM